MQSGRYDGTLRDHYFPLIPSAGSQGPAHVSQDLTCSSTARRKVRARAEPVFIKEEDILTVARLPAPALRRQLRHSEGAAAMVGLDSHAHCERAAVQVH